MRRFSMRARSGAALRVVLVSVVLVAAGAAACGDDPKGIHLGAVTRADVTETVDASAAVTARAVAVLTAPADGVLASLAVRSGQTVTAGQVLAVIDSPSAQARLRQAADALAAVRGGGSVGRTDLSGAQRRTDEAAAVAFDTARQAAGRIGDQAARAALLAQIDAAEQAYRSAAAASAALVDSVQRGIASVGRAVAALTAAQRVQAQAAYDLAKSTVDALMLRAPVSGVVQLGGVGGGTSATGSLADLLAAASSGAAGGTAAGGAASAAGALGAGGSGSGGQPTGPGIDPAVGVGGAVGAGTPVLTVVDVSELGLLAEVDETDVLLVEPGVAAEVELDAAPGERYEGTVESVDTLPTASTGGGVSYRVRLSLRQGRSADGRLAPVPRPGMGAVARLAVRSSRAAVTVPVAAVFSDGGRDAVWLVRAGKARRTGVTVGVSGRDLVEITSGVAVGDRIVVRGVDRVRQDQEDP